MSDDYLIDLAASELEILRGKLEQEMINELIEKAQYLYPSREHLLRHFAYVCSYVAQKEIIRFVAVITKQP